MLVVAAVLLAGLFVSAWVRGEEQRTLADSRAPTQEARNQLMRQYLAHEPASRDGRVVLAVSNLGQATLFTETSAGQVRARQVPPSYVRHPMVSADGRRAAFVNDDGTGGWFPVDPEAEAAMGEIRQLPRLPGRLVKMAQQGNAVSLSLDGRLLLVPTEDRLVWWDLDAGAIGGSAPQPASRGPWWRQVTGSGSGSPATARPWWSAASWTRSGKSCTASRSPKARRLAPPTRRPSWSAPTSRWTGPGSEPWCRTTVWPPACPSA
ncbi:WD40 repeat domain-containing protein [Crossiella cryophila]|uniref:Putative SnoaL-like aldol condensation-catalyzing enzyme n=1 Tax=Crossiella cryophila TaxID=43355 RepID=A0A7W7FXD1_9PSEU|nr:hypothetical protein [Crossiella cryophila]MBB4678804.1 putative SnoaL-like aldol condensation-catalyzing enzyme [Crossiella cryophila]